MSISVPTSFHQFVCGVPFFAACKAGGSTPYPLVFRSLGWRSEQPAISIPRRLRDPEGQEPSTTRSTCLGFESGSRSCVPRARSLF